MQEIIECQGIIKVQCIINNGIFGILPKEIRYLIFRELDFVSLFKAAQVCKEWLQSELLWISVYENPIHKDALYRGCLWQVTFRESVKPSPSVNDLLSVYFEDCFNRTLSPDNVNHFLHTLFYYFLIGICLLGEDLSPCKHYVGSWTAKRFLEKLGELLQTTKKWGPELEKLHQTTQQYSAELKEPGKITQRLLPKSDEESLSLGIFYQECIKILLQLRQLEELLTPLALLHRINAWETQQGGESDFIIVANVGRKNSLTAKGLLALAAHIPTLSPGYEYKSIKELLEQNPEQVTEDKRIYFASLKYWFSQAGEEELLKAFRKSPEIILMEPAFLAHISDRSMLTLALSLITASVYMPFKNPEFVRRLKALPNAGNVLVGLVQENVEFNEEILQTSGKYTRWQGESFAKQIIFHTELTRCLTKDQLIILLRPLLYGFIKDAVVENDNIATRIGCDYDLLVFVARKISDRPIPLVVLAKHASIVDKLSGDTCTSLALTDNQTALNVLEDDQLSLPLKPVHFARLREKYSTVKINALIQQREEEWLEREKAAVLTKTELELYELALSQEELSQYAADCLAGRSTLVSKLGKIKLIRLFSHYNPPFEKLCCTCPKKLLFAEPLLEILVSQSLRELFSLAFRKEPIAYLAATCLADNRDWLKALSTGELRSLIQHYQRLAPHAPFVRVFKETLKSIIKTMNDSMKPHTERIQAPLIEKQRSDFATRRSQHLSYIPLTKKPFLLFEESNKSPHPPLSPHRKDSSEVKATFQEEENAPALARIFHHIS
jgi:hypothetical protein